MSQNNIAELRITYVTTPLERDNLADDPFVQLRSWLDEAIAQKFLEPNAICLATVSADGVPTARMVLLKGLDHGLLFFTNYESQKGQALAQNPHAAIVFYWDRLYRQVRVTGVVEKLTQEESADYFYSRPRANQVGAWSSPQSQPIPNRSVLEQQEAKYTDQFAGVDPIPLPPHWGGYRLLPNSFEFWQGRIGRLHDRWLYKRESAEQWDISQLAP